MALILPACGPSIRWHLPRHTTGAPFAPPPRSQLEPTPIDTRGFQSLLSLVGNTNNDSFDLYYGLFMYNPVSGCEAGPSLQMAGNAALCGMHCSWLFVEGLCCSKCVHDNQL